MWKANIMSVMKYPDADVAIVEIQYADDNRSKNVVERISDPSSIKQVVSNGLNELNRIDAIAELVKNPPLGEVSFDTPEPKQEELDAQAYNQKRQELIQAKQDLDLGLITQEDFSASLTQVQELKTQATITVQAE